MSRRKLLIFRLNITVNLVNILKFENNNFILTIYRR